MNKRLTPYFLLAVFVLQIFAVGQVLFLSSANATYMEGHITQNTTWTLVDSPIILSKDVTVDPSATLTIEPGVEVKLGGNFSIFVEGSIYAVGTESRPITFSSNREIPLAGGWYTLDFSSATESTMIHCIVKHATNGITVRSSKLTIKNSEVSGNSQNGISISNSQVTATDNLIANNIAGISVAGDNQAIIQGNTLRENSVGITFIGNVVSGVSLEQNLVLLNSLSGIQLDADSYTNMIILDNTLSANKYGFHITGNATTLVTNNSVSYNSVGFFYEYGTGHVARFNDIYSNDFGMDIVFDATVDATYNYWGDETGPYHGSLNPYGKGDSVGGDGINLDFIFFLSAPIGQLNVRPTARLLSDLRTVQPSQTITFFATTSSDTWPGHVDQYYFDFGDGQNSSWTTLSVVTHAYGSTGTFYATVTVMDDFGVRSQNAATVMIDVQNFPASLKVSLDMSNLVVGSERQLPIAAKATNIIDDTPVQGANITFFSIVGGTFTPYSGLTDSTGHFLTSFSAPEVDKKTYVRITSTGSKTGYADGSNHEYLGVLPILDINISDYSAAVKSEAASNVTVLVTYKSDPVPNATVTLSSDSQGYFQPATSMTNSNGSATFTFTAPQVTAQLNVTISAKAEKANYYYAEDQVKVTVNPRTLVVQITSSPEIIESAMTSTVVVRVTEDLTPIANATVTISNDLGGTFSSTIGNTDSSGTAQFNFTGAEATTMLEVTITVSAAKTGYVNGQGQTTLNVRPIPGPEPFSILGLSLTTILLITIPIVVAIIVLILIKTKVIVISRGQD